MKLGQEFHILQKDLATSISDLKDVASSLKVSGQPKQAEQTPKRYTVMANGRALAEKVVMV